MKKNLVAFTFLIINIQMDYLFIYPSNKSSQMAQWYSLPASAGDAGEAGSILGPRRSPGEGNGHPLQYSCLDNPMDRGALWATVHGAAKSWTRLSYWACMHPSIQQNIFFSHVVHSLRFGPVKDARTNKEFKQEWLKLNKTL